MKYNKNYYSQLDSIIMRAKRRRMARKWLEMAKGIVIYIICASAIYGAFWLFWSMLCYVFPEW